MRAVIVASAPRRREAGAGGVAGSGLAWPRSDGGAAAQREGVAALAAPRRRFGVVVRTARRRSGGVAAAAQRQSSDVAAAARRVASGRSGAERTERRWRRSGLPSCLGDGETRERAYLRSTWRYLV